MTTDAPVHTGETETFVPSYEFDLFFGATTYHCSKALADINFELVVHHKVSEHYDEMFEFLQSILEAEKHPYSHWFWLTELAGRLEEEFASPFSESLSEKTRHYIWLQEKVDLLSEVQQDHSDAKRRDSAQKFLSAWHHLVSDHHIDPRR